MVRIYLVRYGLSRALGRFAPLSGVDLGSFERGQKVVVRTHRGTELGEVVAEAPGAFEDGAEAAPILRVAALADLERARAVELDRPRHFEACRQVFEGGTWPLELIDAEPLLDDGRTVLHYLGPHRLDASGLVASFRSMHNLDVVLEPAGIDFEEPEPVAEPEPEPEPEPESHGCGSCGSGGGGCGSGSGGGCGSCSVKALVGNRRKVASNV